MSQTSHVTDEQIAAARLRLVLDRKLGRKTPEVVTRVAAMSIGRAAEPAIATKAVEQSLSVDEYRRVRDLILATVGVGGSGGVGSEETVAVDRTITDTDLVSAHTAGDTEAFSKLILRHRDRMWTIAITTLHDPDEAADALQEAFITAFRAAASFRVESDVTSWLDRIVLNASQDRLRRRQARPAAPLPKIELIESATSHDPTTNRETATVVRTALAQLPEVQRAPIVLIYIEGYSIAETASILQISESMVKSRAARGRARLAKILGQLRHSDAESDYPARENT